MTHVNAFMPLGGSLAGTLPNPGLSADAAIQRQVFGPRVGAGAFSRSVFEQVTTLTADVSVTTPTLIGSSNVIEQRNGTNAQTQRWYASFTDTSNYTRASVSAGTTAVTVAAESAGTGSANIDVAITPKGSGAIKLSPSMTLFPGPLPAPGNADSGFLFNTASWPLGCVSESSGTVLSYAINTPQVGTRTTTTTGGIFRLDTRAGITFAQGRQSFVIYGYPTGGSVATTRIIVSLENGLTSLVPSGGNLLVGTTTDDGSNRLQVAGGIVATTTIQSSGATSGIGYAIGAGGVIPQLTNKSTGVTLSKVCGQITMEATAALAAGAKVSFVVTNTACAATDIPFACVVSGGTANAYRADVTAVGAGSFTITVENITAGSLSEGPVIGFSIMKAVAA